MDTAAYKPMKHCLCVLGFNWNCAIVVIFDDDCWSLWSHRNTRNDHMGEHNVLKWQWKKNSCHKTTRLIRERKYEMKLGVTSWTSLCSSPCQLIGGCGSLSTSQPDIGTVYVNQWHWSNFNNCSPLCCCQLSFQLKSDATLLLPLRHLPSPSVMLLVHQRIVATPFIAPPPLCGLRGGGD